MSSTPVSSSSSDPVIDLEAIENLRALSPDDDTFLKEIIGIFLEDTPARIAEMKEAHAAGDVAAFSRAAHSLKGSSSNLGASRLRRVAEYLEHSSKGESPEQISHGISTVETEFAAARVELQRLS